ncbi:hypothetical protein GGR22_001294 [Flavobacterium gossypii]|uniref:RHS repeat-associated core domain-containing protein n=2 Tax=Flavobacterium gossypii TaxID=1646119 RepID=A0ABR6DNA4_9FLAO|nr:hypothetical protein [Flavobacterium gossypii]
MPQMEGRCARMPPMPREAWREASASCRWTIWAGFQYQGTALKFFPTAEGYVQATALKVGFAYSYVYNYMDHLGNIRLSYAQDPENPNALKIIEESHYYPFGLKHANYNSDQLAFKEKDPGPGLMLMAAAVDPVPQFVYNYKYNGKEFQDA